MRPPDHRRGRSTGLRDLVVVALVTVVVFSIGALLGAFESWHDWLIKHAATQTADVFGMLLLLAVAAAAFGVLRSRAVVREESLRAETERRFQTVVEQVPAVTYTWDPTRPAGEAPPLYVSPQIENMLGYTPAEWTTDPHLWIEALHPEDRERVLAASELADDRGTPFHEEYRCRVKDGRYIWVRDESVVVARDQLGGPLRAQGVMFDITRQKEAELGLQEAENRYRALVENLPVVTYVSESTPDELDVLRYVAPGMEQLSGYRPGECVDVPDFWAGVIYPEDRDRVLELSRRCDDTGEPFDAEYRIVRKNGSVVWVHDNGGLMEREDGRITWQGVFQDISRRRQAEQALRETEERFRTLVEQLPAITYIEDASNHRNLYISPQIETMFGYTAEEWEADLHLWERCLHPDDRDRVMAADAADTGDTWSVDYRTITRDGRILWVHNEAVLIRDEYGEPRYWQGLTFDISERKESEERLREAEERYRTLVEQLPVAVYMDAADDVSTALYISPQYERITGFSPERRLGDPDLWVSMLHPDDRDPVLAESLRTNETGDAFNIEYRVIAADGRTVWLHDHAHLVTGGDGRRIWQGVLTDITERKLALEALGRRDRILEAAGHAAERFLRAGTWTDCIDDVLARLGDAAGATRAFVFENSTGEGGDVLVSLRHAWVDPSAGRPPPDPSEPPFPYREGGFARWEETLGAGGVVHGPVRDYPEPERGILEAASILSCIAVPVFVGEEWWGYVGFDQCLEEREWQQAEIDAVRVAANTLGAAIDRERAARRLADTEERFRTLVETIPAVTYIDVVDDTFETLYVSPQIESVFGYSPEEWRTDLDLWLRNIHPDDQERVEAEALAHNAGASFETEYRFRHRDGRWTWVRDEAVLIRDDAGDPRFSQGLMYDVTARKDAEQQLRTAEERFRAIVEHIPAAIYLDVPDTSMQTLYVSPQIEEMTGVSPSDWTGRPEAWLEVIHADDRDAVIEGYVDAVGAGRPWSDEYRMRTLDGRTIWVHDETTFLHDELGEQTVMLGVIFDITERKLAEQALRESEQREREAAERLRALDEMKNTFLAAVSHELRSPLTSILGLSLTLERTRDLNEDDRGDLLERLAANARKLDRLLKDLLDIDRLNRGIVEPAYRVTDVGALARRTVETLDPLADRAVIVQVEPVVMSADPAKVERIVENLLMNAARHTAPDRRIWLRVEALDQGVLIAVDDDGDGVPSDLWSAIFEPFRQGPTAAAHAPGTGIGLSLVARFAELHGGRAWVEDREGGGASFRVFLPQGPLEPSTNGRGSEGHGRAALGVAETA